MIEIYAGKAHRFWWQRQIFLSVIKIKVITEHTNSIWMFASFAVGLQILKPKTFSFLFCQVGCFPCMSSSPVWASRRTGSASEWTLESPVQSFQQHIFIHLHTRPRIKQKASEISSTISIILLAYILSQLNFGCLWRQKNTNWKPGDARIILWNTSSLLIKFPSWECDQHLIMLAIDFTQFLYSQ